MTKRVNYPYVKVATGVVMVTLSVAVEATESSSTSTSATVYANETAATQLISTTTVSQMLTVSNALSARSMARMGPPMRTSDSGQQFGLSGGNAGSQWNVWGSVSGDKANYDGSGTKFNANTTNTVLGFDYGLTPDVAIGFTAAWDRSSGDSGNLVTYTTSGTNFGPYFSVQYNKNWSLDAALGIGVGKFDQSNNNKADNARFFTGVNLNYTDWFGNWQVTGKGSLLHGEENYGHTRDVNGASIVAASGNTIDQARVGVTASYWMDGVMPYLGLSYSADSRSTGTTGNTTQLTDNMGRTAWLWALGVNFMSLKSGVTGGIAVNTETGRAQSKRSSVQANINFRF